MFIFGANSLSGNHFKLLPDKLCPPGSELLPQYPVLILGRAAAFLKAGPMLLTFYLPIVLLSVAALLRSAITLARPQCIAAVVQTWQFMRYLHQRSSVAPRTASLGAQ